MYGRAKTFLNKVRVKTVVRFVTCNKDTPVPFQWEGGEKKCREREKALNFLRRRWWLGGEGFDQEEEEKERRSRGKVSRGKRRP